MNLVRGFAAMQQPTDQAAQHILGRIGTGPHGERLGHNYFRNTTTCSGFVTPLGIELVLTMSIVTSTQVADGAVQPDGSQEVLETHTDNVSIAHFFRYLAAAGVDRVATMNNRAAVIAVEIADTEFAEAIRLNIMPTLHYQTAGQFTARFRAAYLQTIYELCCKLSYWLIERINAGDLTDAQVQNAFGLTATQYNTLKTGAFIPQHDAYAQLLISKGQ